MALGAGSARLGVSQNNTYIQYIYRNYNYMVDSIDSGEAWSPSMRAIPSADPILTR